MNYNKFQKFISGLLIFSLLFGITFRFPFFEFGVSANNRDIFDLVSIIVDEDTYSKVNDELQRYGKDISSVLENTKTVILPVPKNVTAFQIASMNEALFYEGYKTFQNVDFESRLIGTVLVGNIPVPEVYQNNETSRSILPYTDFDDKLYIFNRETNIYEYNQNNTSGIKPEVWHGIISPNTGDEEENIQAIKDYFEKDHSFYVGEGFYDARRNAMNGNPEDGNVLSPLDDRGGAYEPYVFYFDSFRENEAINYASYLGYLGYLENKEDLVYNRYTKEFANRLKEELLGYSNKEIYELAKKLDPSLSEELLNQSDSYLENVPDIGLRYITNNAVKKFLEVFASGEIGTLRENVYNAGRYNYGQNVNVDFIPYLITVLDVVNDEIIKDVNDDLETEIDNLVKNGFSRKIGLPTSYSHKGPDGYEDYVNYLYGKTGTSINKAAECSIFVGSNTNGGQLVEANRGLNIYNIEPDINTLGPSNITCMGGIQAGTSLEGYWGRNSPLNLNEESSKMGELKLKSFDYKGAIVDLYDVNGSKKVSDDSKTPNPNLCFDNNYLLSNALNYSLPINGGRNWSCLTDSNGVGKVPKPLDITKTFDQNYATLVAGFCERNYIKLDGKIVKQELYKEDCYYRNNSTTTGEREWYCECTTPGIWVDNIWDYKSITSDIEHKSPTSIELSLQTSSMIAPNLPIDKDRYIDFMALNGNYAKIDYPYLFRLSIENQSNLTLDIVSAELDKLLDAKSKEINDLINLNKPINSVDTGATLIDSEEMISFFSTGDYPEANFDLKTYLKTKGTKDISIDGETKVLSYYDILVFALYWNSLNSVSAKYKFVFENYLSAQTANSEKYYLPKNKSQYEIAYLASSGDAQNMYVGLDPEGKGENPYSDIIGANQDLSTKLLGLNVGGTNSSNGEKKFKCGPPDGVPIWEWIPAIICRLQDMMPPTISIGDGDCGSSLLDLLSNEEKEELNSCNGDLNKNGVNDCIEKNLPNAKIILETDSTKHYYNKLVPLKARVVGESGKDLTFLDSTDIKFELMKIEKALNEDEDISDSNIEIIYDKNDNTKNDTSVWNNYLTFSEQSVRASGGIANYSIGVKDKEANIYLKASINVSDYESNGVISLESDLLKVQVRGERLFISSYKIENSTDGLEIDLGDSIVADDNLNVFLVDSYATSVDSVSNLVNNASLAKEKLILNLENIGKNGNLLPVSYPIQFNLYENDEIVNSGSIEKINNFIQLSSLSKSASYTLEVTDNDGIKNTKSFTILPSTPAKLDLNLGTNTIKIGNNVSTNFVTILDRFNNVVSGNFYDVRFNINGDSVLFLDNDKKELVSSTFEGYKIFRLKSTNESGENEVSISLLDDDGKILLYTSAKIKVIDDFELNIIPESTFKVGGGNYAIGIELKDKNGNLLNDFNSRVYLNADSNFLELEENYYEIKSGVGRIEFTTKTTAGKSIPIELQVEGLGDIITKTITILPDVPLKTDLVLSKSKLEANGKEYSNIQVELRDRYNNLVFNDSSTKIDLEILPKYTHIITYDNASQIVKEGKANFRIYSTVNPGIGYFKISTEPSLSLNSFVIEDESGSVEIVGVGENASLVETFYVWNREKILSMQYNSIYTTLLGANYGDIEQQNYLAGELIFNKNSKALAVTSILNNPYAFNNTFSISNNGGVLKLYSDADLSQDISTKVAFENSKLYLDLFNNSLNTYIGKIYYALPKNPNFQVCEGDIGACISSKETSVAGKSLDSNFNFYTSGGKLSLMDNAGETYLEIDKDGQINRKTNLGFELVSSTSNYLGLNLIHQDKVVGFLGFNFVDSQISVARDETAFNNKVSNSTNSILIYLNSTSYGYYTTGKGSGSKVIIYYNDPFGYENTLNSFSKDQIYSYENFKEREGLGWKDGNKTLLSFAAGENVGESLKEFSSFSSINIGDPVISLKKIRKTFNDSTELKQFDSTIGELVNGDSDLYGYRIFDYNNDGRKDILLIKNNGYLKLLENRDSEDKFFDMGDLAYVVDIGSLDEIQTGDFTGDSFDDIFFVGEDGKPYLLNNIDKDFSRFSLVNKFNLSGNIIRARSFDMDNDGIDDIVTLDDVGEINIFYGAGPSIDPNFTKLTVSKDYGVTLASDTRTDGGGLIYFDSLYQIGETDYSYLLDNLKNLDLTGTSSLLEDKENIDYNFVNSMIFEQVSYSKSGSYTLVDNDLNTLANMPETIEQTTFLKTEYSQIVGLSVEKTMSDRNGGTIKSGEFIDVEVKITNTSNTTKNNMAYIEDAFDYITLDETSITNSKDLPAKVPASGYDLLFDGFSLEPNESITIKYSGTLRKIKYLEIQVGLFEQGEPGDDLYGDIIVKDSEQNCSLPVEIFRSISVRSYDKGVKSPTCDVPLPDELAKNAEDSNGNGIPDYIEELTKDSNNDGVPDNTEAVKEYSSSVLNSMFKDSDKDGTSDDEDSFNFDGKLVIDLSEFTDKVEEGLEKVENFLSGFSCGFNNGACFSTPLNWAPLAPGGDPTFMGFPIGDGLKVEEGLPIFSALTGVPVPTPAGVPICIPTVWPASPLAFIPSPTCGLVPSAGGYLGTRAPTNYFRLFVTPTLTGGVGTAICFGGPASVYGRLSGLPGIHPLFPGGNCIVLAMPLFGCSNDGSDGDPASTGIPTYGNDYGVINGNCSVEESEKVLSSDYVNNYYKYVTGQGGSSGLSSTKEAIEDHSTLQNTPLLTIEGTGTPISITLDMGSRSTNFSDIIKIVQKRISAFPSFLMDWVTRQVEEIVTKLTDFPTLFIILPDFSGIYDTDLSWEENRERWRGNRISSNPVSFNTSGIGTSSSSVSSRLDGVYETINSATDTVKSGVQRVNSSIKTAYEFLSTLPLINIKQEPVNISIPWISTAEIERAIASRKTTIDLRQEELKKAVESWSLGGSCGLTSSGAKEECEKQNAITEKVTIDANKLISSLRANIEIIESYKRLPEDIYNLLNIKERYLEQILCNIEMISKILGGRIGANGERFKAWVELFILIKAILKSWQLLIDIFFGYEASCKECKNERMDLMTFIWELISAVIPQIPVIQFPKWPDIILDLHNIRVGLDVALPEFNITPRPILLPNLPSLSLPSVPSLTLSLPSIPVLPEIKIPQLPDLPSLPKIELPDLPPPPKLPKLLAAIEVIADIAKLITKVMCLLKTSIFIPEWRAGDQIAFLTERNGFLPFDFLSLELPQFSLPFVDAIKVTTYVNLEFETDFIVEMARQLAMPINRFTSDFTNLFNVSIQDIDIGSNIPTDIHIDVGASAGSSTTGGASAGSTSTEPPAGNTSTEPPAGDTSTEPPAGDTSVEPSTGDTSTEPPAGDTSVEPSTGDTSTEPPAGDTSVEPPAGDTSTEPPAGDTSTEPPAGNTSTENFNETILNTFEYVAYSLYKTLLSGSEYIKNHKDELVSNLDFKKEISKNLASETFTSDPQFNELITLWNDVNSYTFSKEDSIIASLEKNSIEKFDLVKDIINTEIAKNKKVKEDFKNSFESSVKKVSLENNSSIEEYNLRLEKYNEATLENLSNLLNYDENNSVEKDIKIAGEDLLAKVDKAFGEYVYVNDNESKLLAVNTTQDTTQSTTQNTIQTMVNGDLLNSCQKSGNGEYSYNYEGIYILENGKSYRLFDYKKELLGDEKVIMFDFDSDGDEDILYFMNGVLYFKENLSTEDDKVYLKENPLVISIRNNKFIGKEFIEAPNNFASYVSANQIINVSFSSTPNIYNYRLSFYDVVDKFWNEENSNYIPPNRKKQVVDAIAGIGNVNITKEEDLYKEFKDIVYISNVGDLKGIEITTDGLKNIKDDLNNGNVVAIGNGTSIYATDSTTTLKYVESSSEEIKAIIIPKNRHIELNSTINVVGIIGDGYVKTGEKITYSGTDIRSLISKPLFAGTKISYVGNEPENKPEVEVEENSQIINEDYQIGNESETKAKENTYIDLRYYDDTESGLDFNYVISWELYDLGMVSGAKYSITIPRKNDFYYAKLNSFKNNTISTISNQILLSPQTQADNYAPLLGVNSIRVPVYQKKELDFTNYIYEDAGISAISRIYIDFDLGTDSDSDGNPRNDDDSSSMDNLNIIKTEEKISIEVGVFEELINKKIGVIIIDSNGNVGNKEVQFEIYSPTPNINTYNEDKFFGVLDEDLTDEPVNIYRLRGGVVTKLENTDGTPFALTKEGDYDFAVLQEEPGLEITRDGTLIARVNEKTGKINTLASGYSVDALASNNTNNSNVFPKIILKNLSEEIFYETIKVSSNKPVQIVENFDNALDSGVYVQFLNLSNYSYLSIPENVSYNPGSLAVFRSGVNTNEELFIVFSDGRINTLNENYTLKYDVYGDYVMLKLFDKHFNREVANVLYKVNSEYVIQ